MGYSYTINYRTGKEVLCCDVCGDGDGTASKVKCPYGYCPAVAACRGCRAAKKHLHTPEQRAHCKASAAEFDARRALEVKTPENVVKAAWGEWATHEPGVTLVITGDNKYHLVTEYEVRSPNWLSSNTYVRALTDQEAKDMLQLAYA